MKKIDEETFERLLMGVLDGELSPAEEKAFRQCLETNEEYRNRWEAFKELKEVTRSMKLKTPPEEIWDRYWLNVYNRIERGIGWVIFSIGSIVLLSYGLYKMITDLLSDNQIEPVVRIGILALILGTVILFVSIVREKCFTHKKDRYREIKR